MDLESFLVLLEIGFPLLGIMAIVALAGMHKGRKKWLVLIIGPLVLLGLQSLFLYLEVIDGNLLTIVIYGIMMVAAWYYYIILIVIGLIKGWTYWRQNKTG